MKLAPESSNSYRLDCRNAFGADQASLDMNVVESDVALRVLDFEVTDVDGTSLQRGSSGIAQLARPGLVRLQWATENARVCFIADDAGRVFDVPVNGNRIVRIDQTTSFQINCATLGAGAQAFDQVQVFGDFVFVDGFGG
ncbi:MAG: hypothetical protein V2J10_09390 [Wenzhouxiangella sp.]|nr:hypothetical protein [Wenzhouxiangella sp.]